MQSAKTRLGADFGSDHELLIAKIRLKLKNLKKKTNKKKNKQKNKTRGHSGMI